MTIRDPLIDLDLIRGLIADQHPDLADLPVRLLGPGGLDHVMAALGDELVVRLPKRNLGASTIAGEQAFLTDVGPDLPLPVPIPVRRGTPALGYPYRWSIVPWLDGTPASHTDDLDEALAAEALGRFMAVLHRPAPPTAPSNPHRGIPLAQVADAVQRRLATAPPSLPAAALHAVFEDALAAPTWAGPAVWVHGDLHPRNVLVSERRVSGVLDFSDVHGGDPAVDAIVAWMLLPPGDHPTLRRADPTMDAATWRRGRGWAVHLGLAQLHRGIETGDAAFARVGRRALDALTAVD